MFWPCRGRYGTSWAAYDPGFTETGGGQCNLDLHKRAVELPETVLVTLIGEGSFHQFHGGITTGTKGEERLKAMQDHFNQYAALARTSLYVRHLTASYFSWGHCRIVPCDLSVILPVW